MEWLADPSIWMGLATLVVLEIVLGIDNLVFIAILADKLPPHQRDKARVIGLLLALVMRLVLLAALAWIMKLTEPLFSVAGQAFAGRDLILLLGGLFLLFKGTMELHERLEGRSHADEGSRPHARFGLVVAQIVVLDAVFSLDSVITAVGMVEHLGVMYAAVTIAMAVMLLASKPLTRFVNRHPTVVVLCLGFLLMIGFSLVAEGFGAKVPKGYLYAAIGFSVVIEALNQVARRNLLRLEARPMRERTAEAVLRMLGKRPPDIVAPVEDVKTAAEPTPQPTFGIEERNMVSGVLSLAERTIHSIMTPRTDVTWIDLNDDPQAIRDLLDKSPHTFFPVCKGSLDEVVGIGRARDLVADLITNGHIRRSRLREPIVVHDSTNILNLMDTLKLSRGQLVLVADEFGNIEGLVTPIDVFEAIAGEFPDEDEMPDISPDGENRWKVDGAADLHHLEQLLDTEGLVREDQDYATLAGYLLERFGQLPAVGDSCEYTALHARYRFEVLQIEGRRIATVRVERMPPESDEPAEPAGD